MNEISQAVSEELAFRNFSIFSSGDHFVHQSETVLAILVECYLSNISVKFEWNRPKGIGEVAFKDFSNFSSGGLLVYWSRLIIAILVGSYLGMISVKFESHWPKGLGGDNI